MVDPDSSSRAPDDDATRLSTGGEATLPPGSMFLNTYVIERLLGRGGMGEVYCARHIDLGTEHAIKIMLPGFADDPKIVQLFREEARKLGRINNVAIVHYEGFFRDERGRRYLVTRVRPRRVAGGDPAPPAARAERGIAAARPPRPRSRRGA
jgi:serine/threonine protein kinase